MDGINNVQVLKLPIIESEAPTVVVNIKDGRPENPRFPKKGQTVAPRSNINGMDKRRELV